MRRKESFNTAARLYDEVRPSYPDPVIDWIIDKTKLSADDKLLEIAPGTGQATMKFGERNFTIHCVELGDKLAEVLMENCDKMNVSVDVSSFEDWNPNATNKYSAIYCATAFHWLDPTVKYKKCADLLLDNGYLVLIWNNAVGKKNTEVMKAYDMIYAYYTKKPPMIKWKETESSGYFKLHSFLEHKWSRNQTKEITKKSLFSQSSFLSLEEELKNDLTNKIDHLFDSIEEEIQCEYRTTVYIYKKKKSLAK